MRAPTLAVPLILLLGACPPGQGGGTGATDAGTTSTSTTGATDGATATTSASTGATTSGPATATTADASSTTDATTTTTTTTTGPVTATEGTSTGPGATTTGSTGGTTDASGSSSGGADELLFACDNCFCDAKVSYCRRVLGGLQPEPPDPVKCPIVPPDDYSSGCVLYPDNCGDTPTCDCIPTQNNTCFCAESMGTFTATCPLP